MVIAVHISGTKSAFTIFNDLQETQTILTKYDAIRASMNDAVHITPCLIDGHFPDT
jgi:hypothetical protein